MASCACAVPLAEVGCTGITAGDVVLICMLALVLLVIGLRTSHKFLSKSKPRS